MVLFDIKEKNKYLRDNLRYKLKELGFSQLQKSVWITPYDFLQDFKEYIESNNLEKYVILIETKFLHVKNTKEFVNKLWQLDKINKQYKKIYKKLQSINNKDIKNVRDREKLIYSLKQNLISIYLKDPYLPKELIPTDWVGYETIKLAKDLKIFS